MDFLPVDSEPFDLKWEQSGKRLEKSNEHEILTGVDFNQQPMAYWMHQLKPKEGAEVVLKAGAYPVIVAGKCGKGKILAFSGTPMGVPGKGQTPFWEWDGWMKLMGKRGGVVGRARRGRGLVVLKRRQRKRNQRQPNP